MILSERAIRILALCISLTALVVSMMKLMGRDI